MPRILLLSLSLFLIGIAPAAAQNLEVNNAPPITPENLISNIFLGDGVEVVSITFEGDARAVGLFSNGTAAVGMDRGIVMTTGRAVSAPGQTGVNAGAVNTASEVTNSTISDDDLRTIVGPGVDINDLARYTIRFVPTNDTLRFTYAFASEEYPEFVCSQYNDVFGFFISGPGINGTFTNNASNIALIPGTNRPVTINNVNPGAVGDQGLPGFCQGASGSLAFSQFYNANFGNNLPVYDGRTDVFVAEAVVIPCQEYTIKLVIADIFDDIFDSGVFLEAKSFGTGSLDVEIEGLAIDGGLAEGCGEGEIVFSLPTPAESEYDVQLAVSGTATPDVDYPAFAASVVIPAGASQVRLPLSAFDDGLTEGDETILISIQRDPCNRDTFTIVIKDNILAAPSLGPDLTFCQGESAALDGTVPIVLPQPPRFTNNTPLPLTVVNTPYRSNIEVFGVLPTQLGPEAIQRVCIDSLEHPWIDDLDIFLVGPNGQFVELTTDNGADGGNGLGPDNYLRTCFTPTATTRINAPGPFAPASAVPFTGDWLPEGRIADLWDGDYQTNGTWQLFLTDDTPGLTGTLFSWSITFHPVYQVDYVWSPALGLDCTDCPNPTATPNASTVYTVIATDSYGCTATDTVGITVLTAPAMTPLECGPRTASSVEILWPAAPGALGYEVSVDGGAWMPASGALSHTVAGLTLGQMVEVEVRALGDCPGPTQTITCMALDCVPPTVQVAVTPVSCHGGADGRVVATVSAGAGPFTYTLAGVDSPTGVFDNLAPGTYSLLVADAIACVAFASVVVVEPAQPTFAPIVVQPLACNGDTNGAITVAITDGNGDFTFDWGGGITDSIRTGVGAGTFPVALADANGCPYSLDVSLTEPTALTVAVATSDVRCFGQADGSAWAIPTGGTGTYRYAWVDGQTTDTLTHAAAGSYPLTVTDANGCTATATAQVGEPTSLSATSSTQPQACTGPPNGQATALPQGGTPPYTYAWTDGQTTATATGLIAGSYQVAIQDANDCVFLLEVVVPAVEAVAITGSEQENVSCFGATDGQFLPALAGGTLPYTWSGPIDALAAGNYNLTVTDANGCTDAVAFTITQPAPLTVSSAITNVVCEGELSGAVLLTVGGGTQPYGYAWQDGTTAADRTGITAGNYRVTVTDAQGCNTAHSATVQESTTLRLDIASLPLPCASSADGEVRAQVTGGQPPYQYAWSNGSTAPALLNVPPGEYALTVTDQFGCIRTLAHTLSAPPALALDVVPTDASCNAARDGRLRATATGGTAPYRYRMNGGLWQAGSTFLGLPAGSYTVEVQDANGCATAPLPILVLEPNPLIISLGERREMQFGDSLDVVPLVFGDFPVASYTWSPFDPSWMACADCADQRIFPVNQQHLFLLVTDEQGCQARADIQIRVSKDFPVEVPTGFTPNNDGTNDRLLVHGMPGITILTFRVWDRWGELLHTSGSFTTNDDTAGWDGTYRDQTLNDGVYLWQVEALLPDGTTTTLHGQTTLIR